MYFNFRWAKPACLCSYCCIHHHWFNDRGRLGIVEIATLRVGARAKKEIVEEEERKNMPFSLLSPNPLPCFLWLAPTSPLFWSSIWCLCEQKNLCARRKHLHCRLNCIWLIKPLLRYGTTSPSAPRWVESSNKQQEPKCKDKNYPITTSNVKTDFRMHIMAGTH